MKPGIYPNLDNDAYHSDGALSVSGAKLLLPPSCPAKFRWTRDNGEKPKRVWDFGSLAHALVLGKGIEQIVVVDAPDYRTKAAQQARDDAHAKGRVPVLPKDMAMAEAMAAEVLRHPIAGPLFEFGGMAEYSMFWTDGATGVPLRARADWICADGRTLVDYKTSVTVNPSALERKWWDISYHMQAAHYMAGFAETTGTIDPDFLFVAQEKEPPYLVTVARYDPVAIDDGRRLMRQAIDLYARCVETNTWPGYTDAIASLSLPPWALRDADTQAAQALIAELESIA